MSTTLIDQVCDIAKSGNDAELRRFLSENSVDLQQKNSKGFSIFESLINLTPDINEEKDINHLKVVNTLLLNGATPLGIDRFEEKYPRANEELERNKVAFAFLMTGRDKMFSANFPFYQGPQFNKLRDETILLVDAYIQARVKEEKSRLIDKVCEIAATGDNDELNKFLLNNKGIDLKQTNSEGKTVLEYLLSIKLGVNEDKL